MKCYGGPFLVTHKMGGKEAIRSLLRSEAITCGVLRGWHRHSIDGLEDQRRSVPLGTSAKSTYFDRLYVTHPETAHVRVGPVIDDAAR